MAVTYELFDFSNRLRTSPIDTCAGPLFGWVGSKQGLLHEIIPRIPYDRSEWIEPFIGGGSVCFAVQPDNAVIADANAGITEVYRAVRDDADSVITAFNEHFVKHSKQYFYKMRDKLNTCEHKQGSSFAALFLYVVRHAYSSMYRENASGEMNVPIGDKHVPIDENRFRAVSCYLKNKKIINCDFYKTIYDAKITNRTFVYLDPPYIEEYSKYTKSGFSTYDHMRLRQCCDHIDSKGGAFLLSNSDTPKSREIYKGYKIESVCIRRNIRNLIADPRNANEILVSNY